MLARRDLSDRTIRKAIAASKKSERLRAREAARPAPRQVDARCVKAFKSCRWLCRTANRYTVMQCIDDCMRQNRTRLDDCRAEVGDLPIFHE